MSHFEIRSPTFKGSLRSGRKTLFQFGEAGAAFLRVAVLEAPIDALSLAAIERLRRPEGQDWNDVVARGRGA